MLHRGDVLRCNETMYCADSLLSCSTSEGQHRVMEHNFSHHMFRKMQANAERVNIFAVCQSSRKPCRIESRVKKSRCVRN